MSQLRVVDFFCGAGGFSEGFRQADFNVIKGVDNWAPAIRTHNLNHGLHDDPTSVLEFEDLDNIHQLPNSEVIVGSPPCVSFSLSNKGGNADKSLGIRLIEAYLRVVAVKKHQKNSILKAWLMENVPNSRNYVKELYTFEDLNLSGWSESIGLKRTDVALRVKKNGSLLRASDYGAAQARNRFVCGEMVDSGVFPEPRKANNTTTVADIRKIFPAPLVRTAGIQQIQDPNYSTLKINENELTDHHYDTGVYEIEWQKAKAAKTNHPYMGKMSFPENEERPSRTIMATRSASTREAILYKSEIRRMGDGKYRLPTVREAASIMGFPLTYVFYGNEATKWRQVGNAVCPQMAFALANEIRNSIGLRRISTPKVSSRQIKEGITTLDDYKENKFIRPPKKSSKALFRSHPIKAGNMTVALTNRNPINEKEWSVIAYMGTGKGYKIVEVSEKHKHEAEKILFDIAPDFIKKVSDDFVIVHTHHEKLNRLNANYHYQEQDGHHPLSLVNRVGYHIKSLVDKMGDRTVDTDGYKLKDIKRLLPMSQLMAIYGLGTILYPPSKSLVLSNNPDNK